MTQPVTLYAFPTPNGVKVSTLLEALEVPYKYQRVSILNGEVKSDWFTKLNPNGRIPTLVDPNTNTTISQTAAIDYYLADTYDKERKWSYAPGTPEWYQQLEIVMFLMGEQGPIQGQANHFVIYAPEKVEYGIKRYTTDIKRIYGVLDEYLKRNGANGPYFVGTHYSIADFVVFGWANRLDALGIELAQWPHVQAWYEKFKQLAPIQKGIAALNEETK